MTGADSRLFLAYTIPRNSNGSFDTNGQNADLSDRLSRFHTLLFADLNVSRRTVPLGGSISSGSSPGGWFHSSCIFIRFFSPTSPACPNPREKKKQCVFSVSASTLCASKDLRNRGNSGNSGSRPTRGARFREDTHVGASRTQPLIPSPIIRQRSAPLQRPFPPSLGAGMQPTTPLLQALNRTSFVYFLSAPRGNSRL